jgi:hypothetical protein
VCGPAEQPRGWRMVPETKWGGGSTAFRLPANVATVCR